MSNVRKYRIVRGMTLSTNTIPRGDRQVDGAIGSLDALYEVTNAVNGQLAIGFLGGIRGGTDT